MSLTRNFLKAMGLTDEQVNAIIENHAETVDALKAERDRYKGEAAKVEGLTAQLTDANDKLAKSGDAAKVQADFDAYKATVAQEKTAAAKHSAMDALLKRAGVQRDSFRAQLLKGWDMETVELDDNNEIKDAEALEASVKRDYADFVSVSSEHGVPPANPPAGGGATKMTREDIFKITNPADRRAAIAANLDLFD